MAGSQNVTMRTPKMDRSRVDLKHFSRNNEAVMQSMNLWYPGYLAAIERSEI